MDVKWKALPPSSPAAASPSSSAGSPSSRIGLLSASAREGSGGGAAPANDHLTAIVIHDNLKKVQEQIEQLLKKRVNPSEPSMTEFFNDLEHLKSPQHAGKAHFTAIEAIDKETSALQALCKGWRYMPSNTPETIEGTTIWYGFRHLHELQIYDESTQQTWFCVHFDFYVPNPEEESDGYTWVTGSTRVSELTSSIRWILSNRGISGAKSGQWKLCFPDPLQNPSPSYLRTGATMEAAGIKPGEEVRLVRPLMGGAEAESDETGPDSPNDTLEQDNKRKWYVSSVKVSQAHA